jgi:hypothetical protein
MSRDLIKESYMVKDQSVSRCQWSDVALFQGRKGFESNAKCEEVESPVWISGEQFS